DALHISVFVRLCELPAQHIVTCAPVTTPPADAVVKCTAHRDDRDAIPIAVRPVFLAALSGEGVHAVSGGAVQQAMCANEVLRKPLVHQHRAESGDVLTAHWSLLASRSIPPPPARREGYPRPSAEWEGRIRACQQAL